MSFDILEMKNAVAEFGVVARVVVIETSGSTPRGAGASMLVWDKGQSGTIGGGALEFEAARRARLMDVGKTVLETIPLGPSLGQCCGGSVKLVTEVYDASCLPTGPVVARRVGPGDGPCPEECEVLVHKDGWLVEPIKHAKRNIWIYGAGHVGRALVDILAPLPGLHIVWVDTAKDRFPESIAQNVEILVASDPTRAVRHAPANAEHLILTYSHEIDLGLCHALLSSPSGPIGLIGSATKWARFKRRLTTLGHSPTEIGRIACPIGDPKLGKHPQTIAIGVAMAMLSEVESRGAMGTG